MCRWIPIDKIMKKLEINGTNKLFSINYIISAPICAIFIKFLLFQPIFKVEYTTRTFQESGAALTDR